MAEAIWKQKSVFPFLQALVLSLSLPSPSKWNYKESQDTLVSQEDDTG